MIITKTPLRISFCGGGTDLPAFYEKAGYGSVISSSIDQYVYLAVHQYFENKFLLKYSSTEMVDSIDEIKHPLIRESLRLTQTSTPVEITSFADIPSSGSGLGSSSAFTVGLLNALTAFKNRQPTHEACARQACEIEIEILGEPIGKQDQYACAHGGMNYIRFQSDGGVHLTPIHLSKGQKLTLQNHLALYYTGITRSASVILQKQKDNLLHDPQKYETLLKIRDQADALFEALSQGNLDSLGHFLHEGWVMKRELAQGITNPELDRIYRVAQDSGAIGGKILGAGGGGFFLFYRPPTIDHDLDRAMEQQFGLRRVPFEFENQGTRVIFIDD